MAKVTAETIDKLGGYHQVGTIIENAPSEATWYVHEVSNRTGEMGYYADGFCVGIHNLSTHYKIEDLKQEYRAMATRNGWACKHINL